MWRWARRGTVRVRRRRSGGPPRREHGRSTAEHGRSTVSRLVRPRFPLNEDVFIDGIECVSLAGPRPSVYHILVTKFYQPFANLEKVKDPPGSRVTKAVGSSWIYDPRIIMVVTS